MSNNPKPGDGKPGKPADKTGPIRIAPAPKLFRRLDWITFAVSTLLVFAGYFYTLAPDLTLEDSGELAVGSYYAGVPHPPGYPVWTLYTWLFTHIPYSNIAWRVALSSAVAGALACGLLGLLVSRGSSLLLEGIQEFKNIDRKVEDMVCMVSGFVSAMLFGFNGFMWSQAVIVEVYTLSVLSFMAVLVSLMQWIHAPERRRYLYWAFFWFGICFTNHQTLIVAAMGIEVAVLAASPRLGRDMFIGNSVVYLLGLLAKTKGWLTSFDNNGPLFMVYNAVGVISIAVAVYMLVKIGPPKVVLKWDLVPWVPDWTPLFACLGLWLAGAAFYFYMPLASMTNPPMNWGYPRTVEGFIHALTRGQYDKTNPTDTVSKFFAQIAMYFEGARDEFSLVYLLIGLIPFLFFMRMQKRERAWIVGLTAIYLLLAFLLLILLNPNVDRQSRDLSRVFFTASHIIIAIFIGYGLTLICGMALRLYEQFRRPLLWGGAVAVAIQVYYVADTFGATHFTVLRLADLSILFSAILFTAVILLFRQAAPLPVLLAIFAFAPVRSVLSNWSDAEQRGHLFGYWFGHDMFTPPFDVYPEMAREAVLFGGTDPGRFNPTYMIFCESFLDGKHKRDPDFDRRDVYLITQNALADKTYLDYIRAHYNRSAQKDPYFFSELFRSQKDIELYRTNLLARMMLPLDRFFTGLGERIEKSRRERGVYPPKEILTPSPQDSQDAFQDYVIDAQRRLQHDMQFPNEPPMIKPGEDVRIADGKIQVAGQVAVMAINGLLTKIIFEKNPGHEFYVEESFPLDWMFPHLTPFGIILKINRETVPELTGEILRKDHEFWSRYSERLIGNWITYDTPVQELCDFAEKTFLRRNFDGFKGDPKFVRDSVAQKAFSKLRSAIAGIYQWRLQSPDCPPQFRPQTPEARARLVREAEFALKQAFAFCPYSPEAVFKFCQVLLGEGRVEEARLVAQTSLKFDDQSQALQQLVRNLGGAGPVPTASAISAAQSQVARLEQQYRASPTNQQVGLDLVTAYFGMQRYDLALQMLDQVAALPALPISDLISIAQGYVNLNSKPKLDAVLARLSRTIGEAETRFRSAPGDLGLAFELISAYMVTQQTNKAVSLADELVARPDADTSVFLSAAQVYAQMQDVGRLESTLARFVAAAPAHPEGWYDLAAVQSAVGKPREAIASLRKAIELNDAQPRTQPGSKNLRVTARSDLRFAPLQTNPEFQRLVR